MNINMYQRNDRIEQVTIKLDGDPLNLNGFDVVFQVKKVMKKTIGDGITIVDEANGIIEIEINAEDTDVDEGFYQTELLVKDILTKRYTVQTGRMTIMSSIVGGLNDE